jgi:uncharacterized membrane protein
MSSALRPDAQSDSKGIGGSALRSPVQRLKSRGWTWVVLAVVVAVVVVVAYLLVTLVPILHRAPIRYEITTAGMPLPTGRGPNFSSPRNGILDFSWQSNSSYPVGVGIAYYVDQSSGSVYSDSATNGSGSIALDEGFVYAFTVGGRGPVTVNVTGAIEWSAPLLS